MAAYRATAESFIYVLTENNLKKIKKTISLKTKYEQLKMLVLNLANEVKKFFTLKIVKTLIRKLKKI